MARRLVTSADGASGCAAVKRSTSSARFARSKLSTHHVRLSEFRSTRRAPFWNARTSRQWKERWKCPSYHNGGGNAQTYWSLLIISITNATTSFVRTSNPSANNSTTRE